MWDTRFRVVYEDLQEPGSCGTLTRREYRSVGKENSGCGSWCQHYRPRAGRYDVAVAHSASACFQFALELLNVSALHNALFMNVGAGGGKSHLQHATGPRSLPPPRCQAEGVLGSGMAERGDTAKLLCGSEGPDRKSSDINMGSSLN